MLRLVAFNYALFDYQLDTVIKYFLCFLVLLSRSTRRRIGDEKKQGGKSEVFELNCSREDNRRLCNAISFVQAGNCT